MKEHELLRECLETLRVHMKSDLAERIEAFLEPEEPEVNDSEDIIKSVIKVTGIQYFDMVSGCRRRDIVEAVYITFVLVKAYLKYTHTTTGAILGRDHSTVTYAIKTVSKWLATDKNFRDKYNAVKAELWKST